MSAPQVIDQHTGEVIEFDKAAAEERCKRIRTRLDGVADSHESNLDRFRRILGEIKEAVEEHGDAQALDYPSPGAYVADRYSGALDRLGIDFRREAVSVLESLQMSTRAIASVVGVSQKTVVKDGQARRSQVIPEVSPDPHAPASTIPQGEPVSRDVGAGQDNPSDVATGGEVTPFGSRHSVAPEESEVEEPGEAVEALPTPPARPAVTGLDGKTYPRPEPTKPKRRPLIDAFTGKRWDAQKAVESLARLIEDDRYPQNAEKVATANRSDLIRIKDQLELVIDALPHI